MTKSSVRKQLLLQSALALSLAGLAAQPAVADLVVSTTQTNANIQITATNEQVAIVPGGNITDSGHAGIDLNGKTAGLISVATGNIATGITGTGHAAIDASATNSVLTSLLINSGIITSNVSTGTILLGGTVSSPSIDVEGGSITNTGTGSVLTTTGGNTHNTAITFTNKGTVTSSTSSPTLNILDTNGGSSIGLTNSGTLGAVGGTALHLANPGAGTNSASITNSGTINGNLDGGSSGTNTITVTSNTGGINGDVFTYGGALSITQGMGGSITGNISTNSGELTLVNNSNSTIDGTLTFGSASTSTAAFNGSSSITGNVSMGNALQTLTLDSSATNAVIGTIDGPGLLVVAASTTSDGVIGGTTPLTNITVNSGQTFTLANNANATTTTVGGTLAVGNGDLLTSTVTVDSTGTLKVGTTAVAGTINGDIAGDGNLEITGTETSNGVIGGTYALSNIKVDSGDTFTLANNAAASTVTVAGTMVVGDSETLDDHGSATAVTIDSTGTLKVGSTAVNGTINGDAGDDGNLEITNSETSNGIIGGTYALSNIKVDSGKTFTLGANAAASTVTVAGTMVVGDSYTLDDHGSATAVTIDSTGTLKVGSTAVNGTIDGDAAGDGNLEITNSETSNGVIGGTFALSNIKVDSGKTFTLANNAAASTVTVAGTMVVGDGETLDDHGSATAVTIDSTGTLKVGSTAVNGTIDGDAAGDGNLEITNSETSNGVIGGTFALSNIKVDSGKTFTVANNAAASTVTVAGTMVVGDGETLDDHGSATAVTIDSTGTLKVGSTAVNGTINGDAAGHGNLEITNSETSNGVIGGTYALNNITVDSGKTFTLANNAAASTVTVAGTMVVGDSETLDDHGSATAVTIDSTGTLKVGSTAVNGTIDGDAAGHGDLEITNTETSQGVIGGTYALNNIKVDSGDTFTLGYSAAASTVTVAGTLLIDNSHTLDDHGSATAVTIDNGGILKVGNPAVDGTIDGDVAGDGTLEITDNQTSNGIIGGNFKLANIAVDSSKTFTLANAASATDFTLASNSTLALGDNTATGAALLGNTAILSFNNTGSVFSGTIDGNGGTHGEVEYNAAGSFVTGGAIGATNSVWSVTVNDAASLEIANNIHARSISIGEGGAGASATQDSSTTVTTTHGVLVDTDSTYNLNGGTIDSTIALGSGAILNIASGSELVGTIDGASGPTGTVNVNGNLSDYYYELGATNGIAALNIGTGATLQLGSDVNATQTTIHTGGSLDFGSSARTITGDLTSQGTGDINLEDQHSTLTANLITGTTGTLDVKLDNNLVANTSNTAGQLAVGGTANIGTGTHLILNASAINDYNPGFTGINYTLITSTGLTDGLDISGIAPNIFTKATDVSTSDDLIIHMQHLGLGTYAENRNEAAVGVALDTVTLPASGNLNTFINNLYAAPNGAAADALLNQALPQTDNGVPTVTFDDADMVADTVQLRMASLRDGSTDTGMAAGEQPFKNNVWMQGFGQRGDQDNSNGEFGYKANTGGVALGIDHSLDSINGYGGFSVSYANSAIDSNDDLKKTTADSYQANLYATKKFNNSWYLDGLLGAAYNQFDTSRTIVAPLAKAEGDFNGETYVARLGTGRNFALGSSGLSLTPGATLTYAYSTYQSYTETGAGTMDLNVSQDSTQELQSKIGSGLGYSYTTGNGTVIRPAVHAAWLYDIVNDGQSDTSTFTGGGASFDTKGLSQAKNGLDLGADVNVYAYKGVDILANYDYEKRSDYTSNTGMLRLRYNY